MEDNEIKMKECVVTENGVVCTMDKENHQKMIQQNKVPEDLIINVIKETSIVQSTGETKHSEADFPKKQSCGCPQTPESSKTDNSEAKKPLKSGEN